MDKLSKEVSIKPPYVCGALTELSPEEQEQAKAFYEAIADCCEKILGVRAFVPHEHYDPVRHFNYTPTDVDNAERRQVCENTSCLIVCTIAPSWGGGIEVEMARCSGVPVILICESKKLKQRKVSRLLRGNPAVEVTIEYDSTKEALDKLSTILPRIVSGQAA